MDSKKINLFTPVGYTGYGVAGFNIYKELVRNNFDVALFTKDADSRKHDSNEYNLIIEGVKKADFFDLSPSTPFLKIWHQHDLATRMGRGKYYAYPFFELDTFTDVEKHSLQCPDELIVSSKWAKSIIEQNNINTTTHVVPLGVDDRVFNIRQYNYTPSENIVFLNCGKWEIRKGHDFIAEVFENTFDKNDNVELWLMPTNVFLQDHEHKAWCSYVLSGELGRSGKIKIIPAQKTHKDVATIMNAADVGVFPSRAEGWNLELLEMMALGKSVITTNYSAHTEYCNNENAMLIEINELEPALDGRWFFEQGNWAHIGQKEKEQFSQYLRSTFEDIRANGRKTNEAGIETARQYTWSNTVGKIEKILLD